MTLIMKNYKYKINVMDEYKTVQELQLGKSIARYGDGEFPAAKSNSVQFSMDFLTI